MKTQNPILPATLTLLLLAPGTHAAGAPWARHTIDASSRGADGVRLADINGDGQPDIATGWEEGGVVRAYLHPGRDAARAPWPAVTVGAVKSPEDAVFADLDGDGATDVVSCCEGRNRTVYIHWAPAARDRQLAPAAWTTTGITCTAGAQSWMYALPLQLDGRGGVDLVVGSKGEDASVGWLRSPDAAPGDRDSARDPGGWSYHRLYDAGWIMSIEAHDIDRNGNPDLVVSDRKGGRRGVLWLENPGRAALASTPGRPWREHRIGAGGREVMFLDLADLDGDGRADVLAAVKRTDVFVFLAPGQPDLPWPTRRITLPPATIGHAKAVRAGDLDGDGRPEIVFSCEGAAPPRSGVVAFSYPAGTGDVELAPADLRDISGPEGIKFDHLALLDIDGDGDLDVLTCEERDRLGVFWYQNPAAP